MPDLLCFAAHGAFLTKTATRPQPAPRREPQTGVQRHVFRSERDHRRHGQRHGAGADRGDGRGKINLTGDLRIGTKARVEATVHAKNVTVEGKLTGDVSADERVELVASATVDGNIKAPKIIVAEGARFRGSRRHGIGEAEANHAEPRESEVVELPVAESLA